MLYTKIAAFCLVAQQVSAAPSSPSPPSSGGSTCHDIKSAYQMSACCGQNLMQQTNYEISTPPPTIKSGTNVCAGVSTALAPSFPNTNCSLAGSLTAAIAEQAGANVTAGYVGGLVTSNVPITSTLRQAGLCPVNVHWHLGAEHLSVGQFDETGTGPSDSLSPALPNSVQAPSRRKLAAGSPVRRGNRCHKYDSTDPKFTTPYPWKHCVGMVVGETYEVHWPHSGAGACGTPNQYQTPFYDGVFCHWGSYSVGQTTTGAGVSTQNSIGVHSQTYTIVNDDNYYYPDMISGMIVDGDYGADLAKYTGSTTGTSRSNQICSSYTPISWHVDRKCHLISASAFDKMCADMKAQRDDMADDLYAHGSRETVADFIAANNMVNGRRE